jgi:hypothetical protein
MAQGEIMKNYLFCLLVLTALIGLSCASTPSDAPVSDSSTSDAPSGRPQIEGEVTQAKVNDALEQIYASYQTRMDMTGAREYTVVRGDTLSQIARNFYGSLTDVGMAGTRNGFYFPLIMLASPGSNIVDPDLIVPGLKLNIPDIKRNLANPVARQAIKDCLTDVAYVYNKKGKPSEEEGLLRLANSL